MSTTIEAREKIEAEEPAALSEIDAGLAQQALTEGRLDELCITTQLERPIPRPPLVDDKSRLIWPYIISITFFHLLIPLAFLPYFFSWWGLLWLPIGNYIFCSMGIGAGYHRLLTHRGYKCPVWLEHTLAVLGCCNLQESPARWVVVHRLHHQHSDHEPDPHTPMVSTFWSHVGWLFIENRHTTAAETYHKYARDVLSDRFYMKLERNSNYLWVFVAHAVLFFVVGLGVGYLLRGNLEGSYQVGIQWLLWGVIYRTLFTWHVTWAVNSASHLWGYRNYETRENSRNNWLVALATNGEGWHNNHHADPRAAAHGHRWWEVDITYATICLWEKMGLAWDVLRPNEALLGRRQKAD
jgi:stearoyl-CoA desaturase (delta-9 desaturase)